MASSRLPKAWENALLEAARQFPKPAGFSPNYGTAGFRTEASMLNSTVFRCAVLMAARSRLTERATGIMITASHNPVQDNGVKLVDPAGEMLAMSWEGRSTEMAQAESAEAFLAAVLRLYAEEGISVAAPARVLIAHDNRPSCLGLLEAALAGANAGCVPGDEVARSLGEQTTPCLHWAVMEHGGATPEGSLTEAYVEDLASGFATLLEGAPARATVADEVLVDCANGVGAAALQRLAAALQRQPGPAAALRMRLVNKGLGGLNESCGADFVQKERSLPSGFQAALDVTSGAPRCVSIDGDGDRVVYFAFKDGRIQLYDGDRIAVLAARLIQMLIADLGESGPKLKVGIVQTAYANGSSTKHMREALECEVVLTATGVKWLHAAAHKFDIGVYFEANGHGTVLFSHEARNKLQEAKSSATTSAAAAAASKLLALSHVLNQAVGDALSGVLLVEGALQLAGLDMASWAGLYQDLPSRMLKVEVTDRTKVVPNPSETKVLQPPGLQPRIDQAVAAFTSGRSFVRPSGTEDVVRVYAEADTQENAHKLADQVAQCVRDALAKL